ncbi:MAG: flavocytochrome c [Erysipelotrichaceae bacterium]|nr:flavocytochrome c [Erysipelotrichaceae bacterium]
MKKNLSQGAISLVLVVLMMITVAFGVRSVSAPVVSTGGVSLSSAKDGTYHGEAKGYHGPVSVDVTIAGGKITNIVAEGNDETPTIGGVALTKLPEKIVDAQSLDVELVAGASFTSEGVINAMYAALATAGVDASGLKNQHAGENVVKTDETKDVDVVVIGAGGAGMTAAIVAKQNGLNVVLLEKMAYVGGNTNRASGGMNAASTKNQAAAAEKETDEKVKNALIDSTVENFIADTMKGGHDINDIDLVTTMATNSSDAVEWLESIGAPLPKLAATGGTVHYYLHEPEDGSAVGGYLVEQYSRVLNEMNIELLLETKATSLIEKDGAVVGVKAESDKVNYTINAKAVIIATGGFGANFEMMASYDPSLANAVTTNSPSATGDGIVMAREVGAADVDMEYIQLHPTVFQADGTLVSERLRSNGAILVNAEGNRFTNDLSTRDAVSQAELKQPGAYANICFDSKYTEEKLYQKYIKGGLTVQADTLEELAALIGLEGAAVTNFVNTVNDWNSVCAGEKEDDFGRNNGLISMDQAPYYAIKIAPGVHHTMGGLKINTNAQVLNADGMAIPGLYAAGEVTGGVHGGNRIGGNAVADIVVFGRIAGQSATDYINAK